MRYLLTLALLGILSFVSIGCEASGSVGDDDGDADAKIKVDVDD